MGWWFAAAGALAVCAQRGELCIVHVPVSLLWRCLEGLWRDFADVVVVCSSTWHYTANAMLVVLACSHFLSNSPAAAVSSPVECGSFVSNRWLSIVCVAHPVSHLCMEHMCVQHVPALLQGSHSEKA
jgi:hypothetical protein